MTSSSHSQAAASSALAAAQWTNNTEELLKAKRALAGTNYSEAEIEQLAEYSASTYAKTPEEKAYYLQYYRDFYRQVEWKCLKTSKGTICPHLILIYMAIEFTEMVASSIQEQVRTRRRQQEPQLPRLLPNQYRPKPAPATQ